MELKKDIIESMNEDISNKIADIADLVGEKEEVVRDRLKTLNFRDYIELSKAVKQVEMERAREILGLGLEETKYHYDGKVVHISKDEFEKVSNDFKNDKPGEERMVILDPESGATISVPVKITNEDVAEEINEDEKQIAMDIADYVQDHKKHFDAYPMDVEVDDKIYSYDEYWKILDKYKLVQEYNTGGTMSPGEMRASQQGQAMAQSQGDNNPQQSKTKKAQAMMRLGKKNLGGATAQQAADALDKAGQGKPLTPIQRKAMAQQAASVDQLAGDPKTATQFRNLLNKLNKGQ